MKIFQRRPGAVYAIRTEGFSAVRLRPWPRLGYVGKTRQRVENRVAQHMKTQPWADLYVDHRVLWSSSRVTDFGLWWREIWYIVTRFPVYNYQWNRWNPRRVPIYRAQAERMERRYGFRGGRSR